MLFLFLSLLFSTQAYQATLVDDSASERMGAQANPWMDGGGPAKDLDPTRETSTSTVGHHLRATQCRLVSALAAARGNFMDHDELELLVEWPAPR